MTSLEAIRPLVPEDMMFTWIRDVSLAFTELVYFSQELLTNNDSKLIGSAIVQASIATLSHFFG